MAKSTVHPHARGVYCMMRVSEAGFHGPSPRTWGLRPRVNRVLDVRRSIPTHVGFTSQDHPSTFTFTVHPHARGVYVHRPEQAAPAVRSIPTHVGFTAVISCIMSRPNGPSPRTWGLRGHGVPTPRHLRSIPTHVGFTPCLYRVRRVSSVHPHARGVYAITMLPSVSETGPSPRTWGLLESILADDVDTRSIPTHVGFTQPTNPGPDDKPVHPHARGVYLYRRTLARRMDGPSPRTWGLLHLKISINAHLRSIPTHVGFTRPAMTATPANTVHPHARGVYSKQQSHAQQEIGPSPRTWGLQLENLLVLGRDRSIPTHVGFTTGAR